MLKLNRYLDDAGWTVAWTQLDADGERGRRERIREVNMFVPPFLRKGRRRARMWWVLG
jgi:hypothetical protein